MTDLMITRRDGPGPISCHLARFVTWWDGPGPTLSCCEEDRDKHPSSSGEATQRLRSERKMTWDLEILVRGENNGAPSLR